MKRFAHGTRSIVAGLIARRNAGELTTIQAADMMRLNGISIDITLRVLANERMREAYNALPRTGLVSTPEIAVMIGATVHQTNRALERLCENGKIKLQSRNLNHWGRL